MDRTDFRIVFDKLAEADQGNGVKGDWTIVSETTLEELDEISELRRLSDALAQPDEVYYTTT